MDTREDYYEMYHCHTELSLLDSCTKYQEYVDLAVKNGQKALSISEHGKPMNWTEKWAACKKAGLRYIHSVEICAVDGGMYPTDIDGVIEYKDSKYIIFEVKYGNSEIPIGQRLALQRMVDDFTKSGKQAIVLICSHTVKNPNKPVVMAWCNVREIYYGDEKRWRTPDREIKVREAIDCFQKYSNIVLHKEEEEAKE